MDSLKRENVDYAVLHKLYGSTDAEHRYSPAKCIGVEGRPVMGNPDPEKILASYVERQNHTMRMGMRRFTRFSNGFSNEIENLTHAVSLHYMHYIRKTPPVTRTANPRNGRRHRKPPLDGLGYRIPHRVSQHRLGL